MGFMSWIESTLKNIDFFGSSHSFNFRGSKNLQSCTGGCISVILMFFTLLIIFELFYDYFETTEPDVNIISEKLDKFPKFDLYKSKFSFIATLIKNGRPMAHEEVSKYFELGAWILILTQDPRIGFISK